MSILKKLAGQSVVYGLSSVLGRVINYLLVPLYTSVFAPKEYAVVTELYAYVAFLNILFTYGMETAYFRFSSKDKSYDYFNLTQTGLLISSVIFSGLLILLASPIASILGYAGKENYIIWLALIIGIDAIVAIPFAKLRQEGKAIKFATFKLTNILVNVGLNLFFILLIPAVLKTQPNHFLGKIYDSNLGVGYVFLSNLIANALFLLMFFPVFRKMKIVTDKSRWNELFKYAYPILIIGFAGVMNEMFSRAILKYRLPEGFYSNMDNMQALGVFGACYKLSVFMTLAVQAFRYAFEPFFFSKAEDKNSPELFSQVMTAFVMFGSFSWLLISILLPYLAPIFLRQQMYLNALDVVPWLLGGGLLLGIYYNLSVWYKLTEKTIYGAYISLVGALATFLLNWILIPHIGYLGSAIATFFTYFLMVVISYIWGRKHYQVPYKVWKNVLYLALAGLGILLNGYFGSFLLKIPLIILIYVALLFILERLEKRIAL